MATFILILIYISFISLGLPDGMLGAAWPIIHVDFGVPLGYAGIVSLLISSGTIISSLFSVSLIRRFGTGKITTISVLLTAIGLFGFSQTSSLWPLLIFGIPLGIGAGAVDAALNGYVAEHYSATHMNFLHAFWGIGAVSGPLIMSGFIGRSGNWGYGYLSVSIIQIVLVTILFISLPLWKKAEKIHKERALSTETAKPEEHQNHKGIATTLKIKGVKRILVSFMMYSGLELTMGLWGATFLTHVQKFTPSRAAAWVSIYYGGITAGRLLSGVLATKFTNRQLIRTGEILVIAGVLSLLTGTFLPGGSAFSIIGFIFIGLGCAPIFPGMLHETPVRFGKENAQAIMGFQMAVAYTASTILPPLFGVLATLISPIMLPIVLALYAFPLLILTEKANKVLPTK
ncbi:MAG TPA: MFS transporter [Treponemataceae bacterium]|nr:MFS transporter [Treponemataceae bacterium]